MEDQRDPLVVPPRAMKSRLLGSFLLLLATAGALAAHDLFLKPDSYFVAPGSTLVVRVLNGTFSASEGAVAVDRLRDLTLITAEGRTQVDTSAWKAQGDTSILTVRTTESGTYVIAASLHPLEIALEAKDFNEYLAHDGVPDVLEARRKNGELNRSVRERYSKHVKAVIQVGDRRTKGYEEALGYSAELIPLDNPYNLKPGGILRIRALVDGRPVSRQLVVAGSRTGQRSARTDSLGVARVPIGSRGQWYVKFIHMRPAAGDSIDYESKWATLTFGVR